mmetsp:Transcript_39049/g.125526  ORF Transcript_39049/g.125526 Transcript_39049/m.125526 type:complete len:523 (+) Transcript_39049:1683-3251(+)
MAFCRHFPSLVLRVIRPGCLAIVQVDRCIALSLHSASHIQALTGFQVSEKLARRRRQIKVWQSFRDACREGDQLKVRDHGIGDFWLPVGARGEQLCLRAAHAVAGDGQSRAVAKIGTDRLAVVRRGHHPHQLVLEAMVRFRHFAEGRGGGVDVRVPVRRVLAIRALEGQHALQRNRVLVERGAVSAVGPEGRAGRCDHAREAHEAPAEVLRVQGQLLGRVLVDHEREVHHQEGPLHDGEHRLELRRPRCRQLPQRPQPPRRVGPRAVGCGRTVRDSSATAGLLVEVLDVGPEDVFVDSVAGRPPKVVPRRDVGIRRARRHRVVLDVGLPHLKHLHLRVRVVELCRDPCNRVGHRHVVSQPRPHRRAVDAQSREAAFCIRLVNERLSRRPWGPERVQLGDQSRLALDLVLRLRAAYLRCVLGLEVAVVRRHQEHAKEEAPGEQRQQGASQAQLEHVPELHGRGSMPPQSVEFVLGEFFDALAVVALAAGVHNELLQAGRHGSTPARKPRRAESEHRRRRTEEL